MLRNTLIMAYALAGYLAGTAGFLALIVFLGNWWPGLSVNTGVQSPFSEALIINTLLMLLWTLQHIGMARPAFKGLVTRFLPVALERANYMLFTGLAVGALVYFWMPIPVVLYEAQNPAAVAVIRAIYLFGWAYAIAGILYDSYFEFHGLKQAWCHVRGIEFRQADFATGFLFSMSRRPTFFGILLACWATPIMTLGHFYFSITMTVFTLVGCYFVEKSYLSAYGEDYAKVQARLPLLIPNPFLWSGQQRPADQ